MVVMLGGVIASVTVAVGTTVAVAVISIEGVNTVVEIAVRVAAKVGCAAVGVLAGANAGAKSRLSMPMALASGRQLTCCNCSTVVPVRCAMAESVSPARTL